MIERYQRCSSFQFYIKPQPLYECVPSCFVVPHSNSTSNHNVEETTLRSPQLFLIPILHQTTTDNRVLSLHSGCSSFQFYIKPQLSPAIPRKAFCCSSFQFYIKPQRPSRDNSAQMSCSSFQFYIKPQLPSRIFRIITCCSSFQFYIKPQLNRNKQHNSMSCSSFQFYIKPQLRGDKFIVTAVVPHSNSTSNHNLAHGSNSYSARYTYDTDA